MLKFTLGRKILYAVLIIAASVAVVARCTTLKNVNITYGDPPIENKDDILQLLSVDSPYTISIFAVTDAPLRQIAVGPDGWIFVGTRADKVYAMADKDNDGSAEQIITVADNLQSPHGVAYHDGDLYIGEIPAIHRIKDIAAWLRQEQPATLPPRQPFISGLPTSSHHGMRHIKVGPDGKLYVALGVPCNICIPPSEDYTGVIRRYDLGGQAQGEVYARGIRNAVGLDFHPQSGQLWFTDNGRDWLGDDAPHDELNRVSRSGEHFGYPYCHGDDVIDPEYGYEDACRDYTPPALLTGPHVANLGMVFNNEGDRAYIALHGSWNSSVKVGYAVYQATITDGKVIEYTPFVTGWLRTDETVYGRPVDVALTQDETLLISDDFAGIIYRVAKTQ